MTVAVPFTLIGLDNVVLRASNLTAVKAFYESVLGCVLEREQPGIGLYQLRAGRSLIDLVTVAGKLGAAVGGPPASDGRNMDHLAITIDPFGDEPELPYEHPPLSKEYFAGEKEFERIQLRPAER